jgi:SAM-dependent methyltransferase
MLRLVHRIVRLARNVVVDLRYGGFLGGNRASRYRDRGALDAVNSDYGALAAMFDGLIRPGDVLVDVGCGRGRVLNYWLGHYPGQRVIGLELDEQLAAETRARLRRFPNLEIIAGDALENLPRDAGLLFLYNPFEEPVVRRFAARCLEVYAGRKELRIVYYNPLFLNVFKEDPRWIVDERTLTLPWNARVERYSLIRPA